MHLYHLRLFIFVLCFPFIFLFAIDQLHQMYILIHPGKDEPLR